MIQYTPWRKREDTHTHTDTGQGLEEAGGDLGEGEGGAREADEGRHFRAPGAARDAVGEEQGWYIVVSASAAAAAAASVCRSTDF